MEFEEIKNWLTELYEIGPRRPGSPEGKKGEVYLENEFKKIGLKTSIDPIDLTHWEALEWEIKLENGEVLPSFYIPYTTFTEGRSGELYHYRPGDESDLSGKIAVVEIHFPMLPGKALKTLALATHDPDKSIPDGDLHEATWIRQNFELYQKAFLKGAIGFIGILCDQPGGHDTYYAPYGFREEGKILEKPLPGFWVSKKYRKKLIDLCQEKAKANLILKGIKEKTQSSNILGLLEGEDDETIIVACHHDSPFKNAVEDSSGLSVLLSLAKKLISEGKPKKNILFLATAGHFYGSIGTIEFIKKNKLLLSKTLAEIHIEHIALEAKEEDGALVMTGDTEPAAIFTAFNKTCVSLIKNALIKNDLRRTLVLGADGPLGNYPPTDGGDFHLEGVPVFNYICNPIYLLVDDDDLSKVDWDRLLPVRDTFYDLINGLSTKDLQSLRAKNIYWKRFLSNLFTWLKTR